MAGHGRPPDLIRGLVGPPTSSFPASKAWVPGTTPGSGPGAGMTTGACR
jgi:hypothetical protein